MKITYDKETDILTIFLSDSRVVDSDEVRDGVIVDYDASGGIVSIEFVDASKLLDNPASIAARTA